MLVDSLGASKGEICRGKGRYLGKTGGREGGDFGGLGDCVGYGVEGKGCWVIGDGSPPSSLEYRPGCAMLSGGGCDLLQHLTKGTVLFFGGVYVRSAYLCI